MAKNKVKTWAYLRVSTDQQDLNNQKLEILEYARRNNLKIDEFTKVKQSSRESLKARKIDELLEDMADGDLLIVSELSRLGRSVGQVIRLVDTLISRNIRFIAIKENIKIAGKQDIQTKTMVTLFSLFAEIERDLISQRTKQGLAAARAKGKILGRPKGPGKSKLDPEKERILNWLKEGVPKTRIAKNLNTSLPNLYKWMKKNRLSLTG